MFFLFPFRVDVPMYRWPIANYVLIAVMIAVYGAEIAYGTSDDLGALQPMVLDGWNPTGLIGHIFLHDPTSIMHLLGNMVFLWVFGNAVCEKVGNIAYPFIFLGLGLLAGGAHNVMSGGPMIGASGAINGIVGMFLVWFPINEISCFYLFWIFIRLKWGSFELSSYWMILLWLLFDMWGAFQSSYLDVGSSTAYWAHLGGFGAGFVLAVFLTTLGWVSIDDETERTLLDIFHLRKSRTRDEEHEERSAAKATFKPEPYLPKPAVTPAPAPVPLELEESPRSSQPPAPIPLELEGSPRLGAKPTPRAASAPTAAGKKIVFRCACGQQLQVSHELAGKRARCAACKQIVNVPQG